MFDKTLGNPIQVLLLSEAALVQKITIRILESTVGMA